MIMEAHPSDMNPKILHVPKMEGQDLMLSWSGPDSGPCGPFLNTTLAEQIG